MAPSTPRNRLLVVLSGDDFALLEANLVPIALAVGQFLEMPEEPIEYVYFIERGLVSVVARTCRGQRIEVGMIGHEGMTGLAVVLGDTRPTNETMVQSAGAALRISSALLRKAMKTSPRLAALLLHYAQAFLAQCSQVALANGRAHLDQRLARWLLMWQDRLEDNRTFAITHEFIALLLGVRRQGVTDALHVLEGRRLIRSSRGMVTILDRQGLLDMADGFYGVAEAEYTRLMADVAESGNTAKTHRRALENVAGGC
jgi:CRP-like cAMP-binding protein